VCPPDLLRLQVARMPYFSYTTCLHLYETLGWWRTGGLRLVHFAEVRWGTIGAGWAQARKRQQRSAYHSSIPPAPTSALRAPAL